MTIGTGSQTFTTQAGLAFVAGSYVRILSSANQNNYMEGGVSSYTGTSMTVSVILTGGSGTIASWFIVPAGVQGSQGNQGTQGNQGNQGFQGNQGTQGTQGFQGGQSNFFVQGTQFSLGGSGTGIQNVTGLQTGTLANSGTYEIDAVMGTQVTAGTQGIQFAVQCAVASATVAAMMIGSQAALSTTGTAGVTLGNFTAQAVQGPQVNEVVGLGVCRITGIVVTPATGSPVIGIQAKGVQSGALGWIKGDSYLRVTRIS